MSRHVRPIFLQTLIAGAFFMENLDGTIIATALPQMARSFHMAAVDLNIGMTAYLVTLAVFIPVSGWVADRFGSRTVFGSAILVFTLSSLACSATHNLTEFTLTRILQGAGGAMMVPVGRLIVLRTTPKDRLTQAIAYITWPGLSALALGPPLGGFITTFASWRWIFLLNLPLGVIALVLTARWVENVRARDQHKFDWLSFVLAGIASTCGVYVMEHIGMSSVDWRRPAAGLVVAIVSGTLAVRVSRRRPATALLDLESMRHKTYALSVFGGTAFRIAVSVLPFLLPLMFQIGFGLNAFDSGLYLFALFAGDLSMKTIVVRVLRRFGFRNVLMCNSVLTAGSIALCATLTPAMSRPLLLAILFFHGICRSTEMTSMITLAYVDISPAKMSRANGFLSAVMQLSMGLGVTVGAFALRTVAQYRGHSPTFPQLRDFHIAFLLVAALAFLPAVESLGLSPDAGAEASGHRQRPAEAVR